jgi:hypothetical protein
MSACSGQVCAKSSEDRAYRQFLRSWVSGECLWLQVICVDRALSVDPVPGDLLLARAELLRAMVR